MYTLKTLPPYTLYMNDQKRKIRTFLYDNDEDNAYNAENENMMRVFRPGAMSNTILKICANSIHASNTI